MGILHLVSGGVGLEIVGFARFVVAAEETVWELAQEVLEHAVVLLLALRCGNRAFELLDLGLSGLVGDFAHD